MAKASDNKFPKVILEEVATDGSATTTPAADHRSLFLGEDGALHLKDSSAVVTDVGGGGGGSYTIDAIATGVATEVTPTGTVVWADGVDGLNGRDVLSVKFDSIASNDVSAQLVAIGSATVIETAFRFSGFNQNYLMAGPCFTDGTATSSNIIWAQVTNGTAGGRNLYIYRGGTITAYGAAFTAYAESLLSGYLGPLMFLRLTLVSANTWRLEFSIDGVSWTTFGVADPSSTMTPTHMGVAVSNEGGAAVKLVTFEYFKHNG